MGTVAQELLGTLDYSIKLPAFEGPLDLLLFLIRRDELDIYDIPIEEVTRQYLEVLWSMEDLSIEAAGDFFVMASTLMYIKSRLLLPKQEQGEEENEEEAIDPRWELVQQLIEYKKIKTAVVELEELVVQRQDYLPRLVTEAPGCPEPRPVKPVSRIELWDVFNQVLQRLADRVNVGSIHDGQVTVAEQMELVLQRLKKGDRFFFTELLPKVCDTGYLIATFLALLELTRLSKLMLVQEMLFGDILCVRQPGAVVED